MAGLVGQMLDQYRLVEQVGQGGMAIVYRALDTRTLQQVAVKVLSPTIVGDKRFVKRFRREASLVRHLRHPNILPVLAYGEAKGYVYLAMPFIVGETLHNRMSSSRVTPEESARWIGQVAAALDFAHHSGVIHRDIKPSNIMIDEQGNALLMDFGLARMVEGSHTLTGSMLMGTPAYVSPEQGRGGQADGRSDEYSLGVILYQIATGYLPFEGDTPMATVLMHVQEPPPRPRRINPELSPDIEAVILKTLAKKPADRFPSVAALNRAYQAAVAGLPVPGLELPSALPPQGATLAMERGAPIRSTEALQRPRPSVVWIAAVAAAAVLLLLGFIAYPSILGLFGGGSRGATPLPVASPSPPQTLPVVIAPTVTAAALPTATAVLSEGCPGVRLINFSREGSDVAWTLDNGQSTSVQITGFVFQGPENNAVLGIWLAGQSLWEPLTGGTPEPSMSITLPPELTTVASLSTAQLRVDYAWEDPTAGVYAIVVFLEGGCTLNPSW